MLGDSIEDKKNKVFSNGITYKHVDEQHVEHACDVLAINDFLSV